MIKYLFFQSLSFPSIQLIKDVWIEMICVMFPTWIIRQKTTGNREGTTARDTVEENVSNTC